MATLKTRMITAFTLLAITGLMVWWGGVAFTIFMLLSLGICGWEWGRLFRKDGYRVNSIVLILGITGVVLSKNHLIPIEINTMTLVILFLCVLVSMKQYELGDEKAPFNLLVMVTGVLYIGYLGAGFIAIRSFQNGGIWLSFIIMNTGIGDTGAYFIGSKWGKHKIGKRISPNKSWEGYLGGVVISFLFSMLVGFLWHDLFMIEIYQIALFGTVLYSIVPVGDFVISMIKRSMGVKHTSELLPGHGGFLDRIDTHLWAAAIGAIWIQLIIG